MPKQTFFNLNETKQQRIIDAATEEFAAYPYLKTSINRIIEQADISKGSFYQYFNNKKDLYKYIIGQASDIKIEFVRRKLQDYQKLDFFELLRKVFIARIQFKREYPLFSEIGDQLLNSNNESLKKEVYSDNRPRGNQLFEQLLEEAVKKEEVDPEIDIKFTAFMLTDFLISIVNYFFENHDPNNLDEIMEYVDKMIYIIKNGIVRGREKCH
ncbi:TetR family transcriptional regulator [Halanaerobium saccharolyticum]|uniref:TetR family transcriptional regulator n=1 Tax=Halanaerobium saccharolyticum TaxID=43595 RepID=A0A4R7YY70_9FIRM|nr:TetR/AcrR family transcriptional regulator [Halanaerobium saccharolyticum]RAK07519.1 TetR family transcriptional regulator [Halanaerobium saccharolyticum]TDW03096.1 TetR family transcriptional regulator [Halanaerobium saccharolyticum]TDX59392.1 TetR family transcriptional regulator [Halanaerobium saccharolyticum]